MNQTAQLTADAPALPTAHAASVPTFAAIPRYLDDVYWWAYVHPRAIAVFERPWLVNLILFGNYRRLVRAALDALGASLSGRTLQVACVYGELTERILAQLAPNASLDVLDVLPQQLDNLAAKIHDDGRLTLRQGDSSAMPIGSAAYDQTLLFFLLHEQPEAVRRATVAEAVRVTQPGGRIVLVDYHRPNALHPLRAFLRVILRTLEPYALDLWDHELVDYLPSGAGITKVEKQTFFGGMYQRVIVSF